MPMQTIPRGKHWWIINVPSDVTECGPYSTKREADEDRRGMARSFQRMTELDKFLTQRREGAKQRKGIKHDDN